MGVRTDIVRRRRRGLRGVDDVQPAPTPAKVTSYDVTGLLVSAATVGGVYCFVTSKPGTPKRRTGYVLLAPAAAGAALALVWIGALATRGV
jgi:hypothetical protein